MRILHVIPAVASRYGGPSTNIGPMVDALNRRPGLRAEIVATDADGPRGRLRSADFPPGGPPIRLFPRTASEQWKFSLGMWQWLHRHAGDYDLLHIHALWSFATAAACSSARRAGTPFILRPCGMLSDYTLERSAWKKRLYWNLIESRNVRTARGIHTTSSGEAADVSRLSAAPGAEMFVIPLGLEQAAWELPPQPNLLREACGGRAGDLPIILFLSRLHPKKGLVDVLLPAFARLKKDAFLAIVGGPDDRTPSHEREVRVVAESLGVSERFALLGPAASAERWAMYDGAAVFVLPSHSENFGVVVTEAMARGVPVVVTDTVQSAEHVKAAGAGRVVPAEPLSFATALDDLLSDLSAARLAGARGREYTRATLGWEGIACRIEDMYRLCRR